MPRGGTLDLRTVPRTGLLVWLQAAVERLLGKHSQDVRHWNFTAKVPRPDDLQLLPAP
jgi:hypothetical protein